MEISPKHCWLRARRRPEPGLLAAIPCLLLGTTLAQPAQGADAGQSPQPDSSCLATGNGFLKAKLDGEIKTSIDWANAGTTCEGMPRPNGRGLRLSFARTLGPDNHRLVIVFGVGRIGENQSGKRLPVNVTVIVEGAKLIYGTRGDDKCQIERLRSQPLSSAGHARVYRIEASGFCTQPARAVMGSGAVLMSTFDFAGQVSFDDSTPPPKLRDETAS